MGCPGTGKHAGVVREVVGKIQEGVVTTTPRTPNAAPFLLPL